jgi:hypothetical protein
MLLTSFLFYSKSKYKSGVPVMLVLVTGVRGCNLARQHVDTDPWQYIKTGTKYIRITYFPPECHLIHCKVEIK